MNESEQSIQKKLLLLIVSLFWFGQYVYIPYQTPYLASIGVTSSMIGTIVGAYGISQLVLRLPVGVMADKSGKHKRFIMIGAFSSGAASIFRVIMPNGFGYLIANIFSGLASAMWICFMIFYMSFFSREEQQKATSKIILANNFGMLCGFITSTLFYDKLGMNFICTTSIAAGILGVILSLFIKEKNNARNSSPSTKSLLSVCLNKKLIFFSLLALIQQGIQMTTTMSFTSQIIKGLGASSFIVGLSSIIYMLSSVFWAGFASSKLCSKKGPRFWIPFVFCVIAVYCIAVPNLHIIYLICMFQILPGMSTGILFSHLTAQAMDGISADKKSTAMGCFQAIYAIGMTTFPLLAGNIIDFANMSAAYLTLAVIAIVGCITSIRYYLIEKPHFKKQAS